MDTKVKNTMHSRMGSCHSCSVSAEACTFSGIIKS